MTTFAERKHIFPKARILQSFFYVVPPWHQESVCSQARIYGWPKLQIEKGYQVPIVDSLECAALSLQLELAWFKMTSQRNQKREFHTFAWDGDKSKYVQRWFWWNLKRVVVKKHPFPKWMGINGTTNSSHHLYSCDCNQLFLVKEGFVHLQLTTKKSITKVNAISCTINIEGFGTIRLPSVSFALVGLACEFLSQFSLNSHSFYV